MSNAKEDFQYEAKKYGKPICAKVGIDKEDYGSKIIWFMLKPKYSKKEYEKFLEDINFEYDSGFGNQKLFGKILFKDSFSDRHEYDGLECWDNHKMPTTKNIMDINDKY